MNTFKSLSLATCLLMSIVSAESKMMQAFIYPAPDNWGEARVVDVQKVVISVAESLAPHFPDKRLNPILLKNDKDGPVTLYKKGMQGEYIILVNIHGRVWSKLSYQFSHELCHVLTNHQNKSGENQWFDESLCEAMSLYSLDEMSVKWRTNPPYENWKGYAKSLQKYLEKYLHETHRQVEIPLSKWYQENKQKLRDDPYIREKNEVVGTAIYQLIKSKKFLVSTIQYLNLGKINKSKPFSLQLKEWYDNSPQKNKQSVKNVAVLFDIDLTE